MYINENEVAKAYGVGIEIIRNWIQTNYISGIKKEDGTYQVVEKEFQFLMEMQKVREEVFKNFLSDNYSGNITIE